MIPTYRLVLAKMDQDTRSNINQVPVNSIEAASKAGEVRLHLAWAEFQWRQAAYGDALARLESAEVAAAGSLMSLVGARVVREQRGTEHEIKKAFLVAALEAAQVPTVSLLDVLETTRLRNIAQYNAAAAVSFLNRARLDVLRQRANRIRKSLEIILTEANLIPTDIPGYPSAPIEIVETGADVSSPESEAS